MENSDWLKQLKTHKAIAVIRPPSRELGLQMAGAVSRGGIRLIEITWNGEMVPEIISKLRSELPDCLIGTGTILTGQNLRDAVNCGAQFIFSPHINLSLIELAQSRQIPIIPGALSPTEIVTAWQNGASCVKVFPISAVGGVDYIKSLQGPLGQIPLIPTGGVTLNNAIKFIEGGAIAVGLSGDLLPKQAISQGNWQEITRRSQNLIALLNSGDRSENRDTSDDSERVKLF